MQRRCLWLMGPLLFTLVPGCAESVDAVDLPDDMCPHVDPRPSLAGCTVQHELVVNTDPTYSYTATSTYDSWGIRDSSTVNGELRSVTERDERGRLIRQEQPGPYGWQTLTFDWVECSGGTRRFQDDTADASGPFSHRDGLIDSWTMTNTVPGQWREQELRTTWVNDDIVESEQFLEGQSVARYSYTYEAEGDGTRVTQDITYGGLGSPSERIVRILDGRGQVIVREDDRNVDGTPELRVRTAYGPRLRVEEWDDGADGSVDYTVTHVYDRYGRAQREDLRWTSADGPQRQVVEVSWDCP